MKELAFRQIHLDFHTSPLIGEIGEAFDPDTFVRTLKTGHVNSVTCFAKCHHGMSYYPTRVGRMHPHLHFDLLGKMIDACHQNGIKVPVYISTGWDELSASLHPEWLQVNMDGVLGCKKPFDAGYYSWNHLCHNNSEYINYILAQTAEVLERYDADGLFYDIVAQNGCVCAECRQSMQWEGLDPSNPEDVKKHDFLSAKRFMERVATFIHSKRPDMEVYFNTYYHPDCAHTNDYTIGEKIRQSTHIEIESLPSGAWGYNHFPLVANFHNIRGYDLLGMTGKFHKSWGDFGSLKNQAALEYECFRMLANGAKCSIGDQLHPSGELDETVYRRIGRVYASVEEKEPWCRDSEKVAEIAVMTTNPDLSDAIGLPEEGAMRMMLELHQPFDVIDSTSDLSKYHLLILPDAVLLDEQAAQKIHEYLEKGGGLLLSGQSGLNMKKSAFALSDFGVAYQGEAPFTPDYIRLAEPFSETIDPIDYCFYEKGSKVAALAQSEVLAHLRHPYFNRTFAHFCSHCQTPPAQLTDEPAIVKNGRVIYISKPIFTDYIKNGAQVCRQIIDSCRHMLYPNPLVVSDLPLSAEVTVRGQAQCDILHILHYIPQKKCREIEIVEETDPLYRKTVKLRLERNPDRVLLVPENQELDFAYQGGYASVTVPEINGHRMLAFTYGTDA